MTDVFVGTVGAIGDVHAEHQTLATALDFLRDQDVDRIVCVGDIADGPGDVGRCCELLHDADVVRGNHDRWALAGQMRTLPSATLELGPAEREFLDGLPSTRSYQTPTGALLLCHGIGADDMSGVGPDDFGYALESNFALQELLAAGEHRYIINGHSHRRMVRTIESITIINVGTLFRDHEPCVAVVDFTRGSVRFHDIRDGDVSLTSSEHQLTR